MPISSIVGAGMAAVAAKSAKPKRAKPKKRGAPARAAAAKAKSTASQNQYNYDVKSRATSRGTKAQSSPATGISSVGSVSGSPTPKSTPPTKTQYSADLSAWGQNKRTMRGK